MHIEELINLVGKAFDGAPQPEGLSLHVAEGHDSYDYDYDSEHRQKDYFGRWQSIPASHIEECQSALSFVDKIGMRFYLPAYMVWYLKNFGGDKVGSDHTLYALDNHPGEPRLAEYQKKRFALFTAEQLNACAQFVKFCASDKSDNADAEFAQKLYARYWTNFERQAADD